MASLSYENLVSGDVVLLVILALVYFLLVWAAMGISLYLVVKRPNDRRAEELMDQRWYKWKKQYMWHELWFRTHVIIVLCLVVIFSYELSFPAWLVVVALLVFVSVTAALKYTSRKVENRVPSEDDKKQLYSTITDNMRSASEAFISDNANGDVVRSESNVLSETTGHRIPVNGDEAKLSQLIELQNKEKEDNE